MDHSLQNRLLKKKKYIQKWARSQDIYCYRLYDKDLTEYPFILDWYDGNAVIWIYDRTRDYTEEEKRLYIQDIVCQVSQLLEVDAQHIFIKQRKKQKGLNAQYEKLTTTKFTKQIREYGLNFEVNLSDYLDTGLFLDHRKTRAFVRSISLHKSVLNLFAYTGSFTCYAISGGAKKTVTVDLNKNYTDWTARNFKLNGFSQSQNHQLITQDCRIFLEKKAYGEKFDLIICDPPTFSNSKKMTSSFAIDRDYPELLMSCLDLLNENGILIFSNNSKNFQFNTSIFPENFSVKEITSQTASLDFKTSHRCWKIQNK
jgi:23S rRNA G2069 N7-methylase RlmK/C1962 C5-methylase RlmI